MIEGRVVFSARNLYNNILHKFIIFPNSCATNNNYSKVNNTKIVKENNKNNSVINIYPNPTSGIINIELPAKGNWQITASDISGRVIWQQQCKGCSGTIKHELNSSKGLYFIKITNVSSGEQTIKKVILQ